MSKISKKKANKRVQWRKGTWAKENGAESVRLYKVGKTVAEIAGHFGDRTRKNRVIAALQFAGVYRRKK
ncbi:MAG: hypothetical protein WB711_08285 [Terriglobales bacterium]